MIRTSTLFIVNDIEISLNEITSTLPKHSVRIIRNEEEGKNEFQLLHAQKAIKESYIADNGTKYICLC
ncbi:DNA polymerase III subunit delta', partial [Arcobacteraceae bacterium]|nr:DNA polymerase III subunit delta' [Arcobacteraceae bacterium]